MSERATVFEKVQLGKETTPGDGVSADKLFQSMSVEPQVDVDIKVFRPSGNKFITVAAPNTDMVSARTPGYATYTEIAYPLSSLFGAPQITGPDAQNAYTWTWTVTDNGPDAFVTYTFERGGVEKWTYGLWSSLSIKGSRIGGVDLDGTLIGQALQTGISPTGSPSGLALIPLLGGQLDVYADDAWATLGSTKLGRCLSYNWSLGDKYKPLWVVDSSQSSFAAIVETAPAATFKHLLEADTAGRALLATVRSGATKFVRCKATGPAIGTTAGTPPTTTNYSLQLDFAMKMVKPDPYQDQDGVYAIPFNGQLAHDPTSGHSIVCTLVTSLAGL